MGDGSLKWQGFHAVVQALVHYSLMVMTSQDAPICKDSVTY